MLKTVNAIVEALGGTVKASQALGVGPMVVSMWKARGQIPARRFQDVCAALATVGRVPDPRVFGFSEQK